MARAVKEWVGRNDDTPPSEACKRRILDRQGFACALTGRPFTDKDRPQFDHKVPLWLGGKNVESNLHAIHKDEHTAKTSAEAKVRAKVNANISKRFGLYKPPKRSIKSPGFPASGKPKLPKQMPERVRDVFGRPIYEASR